MKNVVRFLNVLIVLCLSVTLLGGYEQQFFRHEEPCPLCVLQRLAMIGISIGFLLNLKFGIQMQHYAFSLLSALFGQCVSLRQITLHICPNFPPFGYTILGLSLFTWAFIVFCCSILGIIILLFLYSSSKEETKARKMGWWEKLPFLLIILIVVANVITTFQRCGWGGCPGVHWPPVQ